MTIKHRCCEEFEKAMQDGTDNEEWGPLVYVSEDDGRIRLGGDKLAPIKFCPWCGAKITET